MLIINFSNKIQYLKGITLQVGANVIDDSLGGFTENDRSKIIGIGQDDLDFYNSITTFLNDNMLFINEHNHIVNLYETIQKNKNILKSEINVKNTSTQDKKRDINIVSINHKIESYKNKIKTFFEGIKPEPISKDTIKVMEGIYSDILNNEKPFDIAIFAKNAFSEIKKTKKQVLGYKLSQIKAECVKS